MKMKEFILWGGACVPGDPPLGSANESEASLSVVTVPLSAVVVCLFSVELCWHVVAGVSLMTVFSVVLSLATPIYLAPCIFCNNHCSCIPLSRGSVSMYLITSLL